MNYSELSKNTEDLRYKALLKFEQIDLINDLYEDKGEYLKFHADFFSKNKEAKDLLSIYKLEREAFDIYGQICISRLAFLDTLSEKLSDLCSNEGQMLCASLKLLQDYLNRVYCEYNDKEKIFNKATIKIESQPSKDIWKDFTNIDISRCDIYSKYNLFDQTFIDQELAIKQADKLVSQDTKLSK